MCHIFSEGANPDRDLLSAMGRALSHQAVEVRRVAAAALGHVLHLAPCQYENERLKVGIPTYLRYLDANCSILVLNETTCIYFPADCSASCQRREGKQLCCSFRLWAGSSVCVPLPGGSRRLWCGLHSYHDFDFYFLNKLLKILKRMLSRSFCLQVKD